MQQLIEGIFKQMKEKLASSMLFDSRESYSATIQWWKALFMMERILSVKTV